MSTAVSLLGDDSKYRDFRYWIKRSGHSGHWSKVELSNEDSGCRNMFVNNESMWWWAGPAGGGRQQRQRDACTSTRECESERERERASEYIFVCMRYVNRQPS